MKRSGLLLSSLALLLLAVPAGAGPSLPDEGAPPAVAQGRNKKAPPVKGDDGEEIELPEQDPKTIQCVTKCQEPVAQCLSGCAENDRKCNAKCAHSMEGCVRKCGLKEQ